MSEIAPLLPAPAKVQAKLDRRLSAAPLWLHLTTSALVLTLASAFGWAALAKVDEVTRADGKVIPASRIQLVQNLEGGIVRRINTREGALVKEGDLLVQIDATGFGSSLDERREKLLGLRAVLARLEANVEGQALAIPDDIVRTRPRLAHEQAEMFDNRRREMQASLGGLDQQVAQRRQEIEEIRSRIANLTRALEIAREELDLTRPLVQRGAAARIELIRLEARQNELQGSLEAAQLTMPRIEQALGEARNRRIEREMGLQAEMRSQLSESRVQIASLEQSIKGDLDRVDRTEVRAPVSGIVKTLHVSTLGQVVKPGVDIVEIVPSGDSLLIETRIRPQDIAHLRPGLDAVVRLTAYDYTSYGVLKGKLEHIGADTVQTERGETFYHARVRTDRASLTRDGQEHPILPGMVANVDILTGRKTVLDYIVKPITRLQHEALRER
ncbi:MAG: HlyD family type I secretion periplasmic adaptor subunit [Bosea sp. (in: a-proteobacteria)]